jgi:phage pi2 protein 07
MNRDQLLDKIEEITDKNYRTFRGTNEAELHTREELADLIEQQQAPKWQPIEELINLEYGVWVVFKERAREKWTYDIHQITQYTPRETMQRFYSDFLIL